MSFVTRWKTVGSFSTLNSSTITAFALSIPCLYGNVKESYGLTLFHPIEEKVIRRADPDDDCLNSASGSQVAASRSSGGDSDDNDDEAGPWKRANPQRGM